MYGTELRLRPVRGQYISQLTCMYSAKLTYIPFSTCVSSEEVWVSSKMRAACRSEDHVLPLVGRPSERRVPELARGVGEQA